MKSQKQFGDFRFRQLPRIGFLHVIYLLEEGRQVVVCYLKKGEIGHYVPQILFRRIP